MSLSDSLLYNAKHSAVSGHKYRHILPIYNKATVLPGEVMMLNVPRGRKGQFFNQTMSYLKFKLSNTSARTSDDATADKQATIAPDYSISSRIERLDIYHGFNLLEKIRGYRLLPTLWTYITDCADALISIGNVLHGMGITPRIGEGLIVGDSMYYVIPLLSGIVGCMQSKYLPTGDMSAGDLRVEITLANNADGVATSLNDTTTAPKT